MCTPYLWGVDSVEHASYHSSLAVIRRTRPVEAGGSCSRFDAGEVASAASLCAVRCPASDAAAAPAEAAREPPAEEHHRAREGLFRAPQRRLRASGRSET